MVTCPSKDMCNEPKPCFPSWLLLPIFITARKRSLGQGNIFTGVCQSFFPQGGDPLTETPRAVKSRR